jgi:hypothetical protein
MRQQGRKAQLVRRDARRAANAFADAIEQARGQHHTDARREREQRLGRSTEPIAEQCQRFAFAENIAERTGKYFDDQRSGFGQTFNDADGERARTQRTDHEHRQQAVDHLR